MYRALVLICVKDKLRGPRRVSIGSAGEGTVLTLDANSVSLESSASCVARLAESLACLSLSSEGGSHWACVVELFYLGGVADGALVVLCHDDVLLLLSCERGSGRFKQNLEDLQRQIRETFSLPFDSDSGQGLQFVQPGLYLRIIRQ